MLNVLILKCALSKKTYISVACWHLSLLNGRSADLKAVGTQILHLLLSAVGFGAVDVRLIVRIQSSSLELLEKAILIKFHSNAAVLHN